MHEDQKTNERLLYRPREVASITGMSLSYVYRLIASGELPHLRHGRLVRVPALGLREWINRKCDSNVSSEMDLPSGGIR
jgi:excisionase family DNA binding protein